MARRLVALSVGLLLLAVSACAGAAEWKYESFPEEIQNRVFSSASEVPPFPLRHATLDDPRHWPPVAGFVGKDTLDLQVWRGSGKDLVRSKDTRDLALVKGQELNLNYVARGSNGLLEGPDYYWSGNGRLVWKQWHQPNKPFSEDHLYRMYPTGQLAEYRYSTRTDPFAKGHTSSLIQFYGQDGALMGVMWERAGSPTMYWWDGKPLKGEEWVRKRKSLG